MLLTRAKLKKVELSINEDCPFRYKTKENIDHAFRDCDLVIKYMAHY